MQILSVGIYNERAKRKDVIFKIGSLNIVTGSSRTGKSALLEITDYCLGATENNIPEGPVTETANWYYVLLQKGHSRLFVARSQKNKAQFFLLPGGMDLAPPNLEEIRVNADRDAAKNYLTQFAGIDSVTLQPHQNSLESQSQLSVRTALAFCFQGQEDLPSKNYLFRGAENRAKASLIKRALPYFLGADTEETVERKLKIDNVQRKIKRLEAELSESRELEQGKRSRLTAILGEAKALGLINESVAFDEVDEIYNLLVEVLREKTAVSSPEVSDLVAQRHDISEQLRKSLEEQQRLSDLEALLQRRKADRCDAQDVLRIQHTFSAAHEFLREKTFKPLDEDASLCPVCRQKLPQKDVTVQDIDRLSEKLYSALVSAEEKGKRENAELSTVVKQKEEVESLVQSLSSQVRFLNNEILELQQGEYQRNSIEFLKGRIQQEIYHFDAVETEVPKLESELENAKAQLKDIKVSVEIESDELAFENAVEFISRRITQYAGKLRLEYSEAVKFLPDKLTIAALGEGKPIRLSSIGSAENWIGYHLAVIMAFHDWFIRAGSPVPRFLFLDQPSQAFFPEEPSESPEFGGLKDSSKASERDEDWKAVKRQFELLESWAEQHAGKIQIIVCDHVNFPDQWFSERVVKNWRNGEALIPQDWI